MSTFGALKIAFGPAHQQDTYFCTGERKRVMKLWSPIGWITGCGNQWGL